MANVREIFIIHIDKTEHGICKGKFFNAYVREAVQFSDLGEMVIQMNQALRGVLEIKMDERTCFHSLDKLAEKRPGEYFFLVEVLYMEYSSWQGRVAGSGCPRTCFKSVLDLLLIMNQSMSLRGKSQNPKVLNMRNGR